MDDDARSEHPDEGTIHAWLDGALDDATAQALASHVAACRECAERVAEARGLIAGASRVVNALDDVPSATGPAWGQTPAAPAATTGASRAWRKLRVTPKRAAIAATILVALGVSLTYRRTVPDTEALRVMRSDVATSAARAKQGASSPAPTAPAAPPRDALLDSAVARNVAKAQPRREVGPAPGAGQPVPELAPSTDVADRTAPTRVAVGRATVQAQRESVAGFSADQANTRKVRAPLRETIADPTVAAAKRADSIASPPMGVAGASAPVAAPVAAPLAARVGGALAAPECYRVESANGVAATWGPVALPLVVALNAGGQAARVLRPDGQATEASAAVVRAGEDSLLFRLRRLGYEGTLALGAAGEARAGVMRSRQATMQLESVVTTGTGVESRADAAGARRRATPQRRMPAPASAPAPTDSAAATAAESGLHAAPAVPVVARRIRCPG